ncbi:MAG: dockerin type I domain-containing protein [Phycisphaerales bacterium JB038]
MLTAVAAASDIRADDFASVVLDYQPAPGQFINDPQFNDPARALGAPVGGGLTDPDNSKLVSLGAFGGSLTLAFSGPVLDDPNNPLGLDAIVFGNAHFIAGNPNRRWAEAAHIEISRDANGNGLADDAWYLIPGSHLLDPASQWWEQWWDDDAGTATPPEDLSWYPDPATYPWIGPLYRTSGYALDHGLFGPLIVENPNGLDASDEGYFGYADCTPTLALPDGVAAEVFYTVPDDPLVVGVSAGSGGGDAFDIAWAIDPVTLQPANLDGFDFIRLSTAVAYDPDPTFGEKSAEIGGVADVRSAGVPGDVNGDGVVDQSDLGLLLAAYDSGPGDPQWNEAADLDGDGWVGQPDLGILLANYDG